MTLWPQVPLPYPSGVGPAISFEVVDGDLRTIEGTFGTRRNKARSAVIRRRYAADPDWEFDADWTKFEEEVEAEVELTPAVPGEDARREADGETYLRLCALDLDDDSAVVDFINTYGHLGVRHAGLDPHSDLIYRGFSLEPGSVDVIERLISGRARAEAAAEDHPDKHHSVWETLDEFRFGARCIRDLARAWESLRTGADPPAREFWEADVWHVPGAFKPFNDNPWEPAGPGRLLATYLTYGLVAFAPTVKVTRLIPSEESSEISPYEETPELYEVMCLELFNHIVERAVYRTCANESCRRTFVRQQGRAEHGQNRTSGVRYCSPECARAQASREYRRRRRASSSEFGPETTQRRADPGA
jgi:hypothetical protein